MNTSLMLVIAFIATLLCGMAFGFMIGLTKGMSLSLHFRSDRPISPIPWILCFIGSGIFLMGAIGSSIYSIYFLARSIQAEATVIEIVERRDNEGHASRSPVYSYSDASGENFTDRTSTSDGREFSVGDTVPIRYLMNSPHQSRIDYFHHHWMMPIVMGIFSTILFGLGAGLRWWRAKEYKWLASRVVQPPPAIQSR